MRDWPSAGPHADLIQRDPGRPRIALSHEWGDYRATPHFVAELTRVGRFLEGLGHHVDWALPTVDFPAAAATAELGEKEDKLAAAEERWLELEAMREALEGVR